MWNFALILLIQAHVSIVETVHKVLPLSKYHFVRS